MPGRAAVAETCTDPPVCSHIVPREPSFRAPIIRREHWYEREPTKLATIEELEQNIILEEVSTISEELVLHRRSPDLMLVGFKNDLVANHTKVLWCQRYGRDIRWLWRPKPKFLDDIADLARRLAGVDVAVL